MLPILVLQILIKSTKLVRLPISHDHILYRIDHALLINPGCVALQRTRSFDEPITIKLKHLQERDCLEQYL